MSPELAGSEPTLVVVEGRRAGQRVAVPSGETTLGRDALSELVVDDEGVSRHHALLVRAADTVTIQDVGSTNGTWVNGQQVREARELHPGDRVQLGVAVFTFEAAHSDRTPPPSPSPSPPAPARRRPGRVHVGRVVLVGGLANLLLVGAGVVIQFATDWTGIGTWLAAPLTGMVASLVAIMKDVLTKEPEPEPGPAAPPVEGAATTPRGSGAAPAGPTTGVVPPPRRGGVSVLVGVLVTVLVIGVGGVLVTYAVATVSGYVTGNQVGVDRLQNGPVAVDSGGVVTTVERVEHTADFTRVELTVRNDLGNTITLPLYGNATLSAEDGTTLDADPFRSSWSETIAPGQLRRGTIVFGGHLPDAGTTATLTFGTVFEQGFTGPQTIAVPGLSIAPFDR
ncbi:MAG TPA: FHA domain-containing protein [Agromyces sp.]|nr:FHA domain-containing protein [Agromyces sp.]